MHAMKSEKMRITEQQFLAFEELYRTYPNVQLWSVLYWFSSQVKAVKIENTLLHVPFRIPL